MLALTLTWDVDICVISIRLTAEMGTFSRLLGRKKAGKMQLHTS